MAPIIDLSHIKFPTKEEEDQARRFQVVKNYLRNIDEYVSWHYSAEGIPLQAKLLKEQRALPSFQKVQRRRVQQGELKRRLWLGWSAEIQLRSGKKQPAVLPYANAWGPVHAYYAIYMSMHALFEAMALDSPRENHTGSLNVMSKNIVARGLLPLPWSVRCEGCPQIKERALVGVPHDEDPDEAIEMLANPSIETFWARYAKMLETTREIRLEKTFEGWKRARNRKAMKKPEKRAAAGNVPPTTVFDFFLRLRLRSNYHDVRSYVMSAVPQDWHKEFHTSLTRVTGRTCLLLESLIVQHVGPDLLDEACEEFLGGKEGVSGLNKFIEVRRDRLLA